MVDLRAPLPDNVRAAVDNPDRLKVLDSLEVPAGVNDPDFERLSRTAAHIFDTEYGLVSLVGTDWQIFTGCFGAGDMTGSDTDISFCAHTLAVPDDGSLIILDAQQDDRFKSNPLVTEWPKFRFYAGAPIILRGQKVGSLCVLSSTPRQSVDDRLMRQLSDLAELASALFALKDEARVRARTADALLREEWRHALTLEAGKVGSWIWDIGTGQVECNDMFRRMHALPELGTITLDQILEAFKETDRVAVRAGLQQSMDTGTDYSAEARLADSGRWLTMRGRVYQRDAEGHPQVMMGASIDVSENKQTAEQTRLLLRELNHRVKNTLAMIQSVARQTIRQNPDPKAFLDAFSGRLRTISDAHVLLADRDWSGVHLYEVLASQLGPNFRIAPDRVVVDGDDIALPADHALGLGLILHELTTNAHRHGAWTSSRGIVSISWTIHPAPSPGVELHWEEVGGPEVTKPKEYGLGVRLIERGLAKVLDSKVDLQFAARGVKADVWVPLPA